MLEFFHYLHILSAIVLAGGEVIYGWVIAPSLLKLDAEVRRDYFTSLNAFAAKVLGIAAAGTLIGGIGRAWTSGTIAGFGDLFSGYGLMTTIALVLFILLFGLDGPNRARQQRTIESLDTDGFTRAFKVGRMTNAVLLILIVGVMGAMRLGLY